MVRSRRASIAIMLIGAAIAALFASGRLTLNITQSAPIGLWVLFNSDANPVTIGDYVLIEMDEFAAYDQYRSYPTARSAWGSRPAPFLKRVAAAGGDNLTRDSAGSILVNGKPLASSDIISRDRAGNQMTAYPLPLTLDDGQLWLSSESARGFDSRYLGPVRAERCRRAFPLIIFNM